MKSVSVSKAAVLDICNSAIDLWSGQLGEGALIAVRNAIMDLPPADVVPVVHGKWIPNEDENGDHYGDKCSKCGEWYVMPFGKTNFCPNCGAKMDGKDGGGNGTK